MDLGTASAARLSVMTWNVHGAAHPDLALVARVVAEAGADVVALQEVRQGQAAVLADLLGAEHHRWLAKHGPFGWFGARWREGIAVLSHLPVAGYATADLSRTEPMRSFRRRVLQEVVLTTAAGPVRVVNTHLSSDDDTARSAQAARAVELLAIPTAAADISRTVLLGDLNTADADDVVGRFARAGLVDAWSVRGDGPGATNPANGPVNRLDHVLTGRAFTVESVRVVTEERAAHLSDHLPVVADLTVG